MEIKLILKKIQEKAKRNLKATRFWILHRCIFQFLSLLTNHVSFTFELNVCEYLGNIKQEISCWFKEFAWLFLGSQGCKYDNKTYENGTLLEITSKGECHLYECMRRNFRKVSKEMHCDEPCEMGWLPGCCLCKRKSEFSFTILLKSYISAVISYIVTQTIFFLFSCSIPLFSFFPFSITSLSFHFPVFTLRFPLIFDCLFYFLRTLFVVNTTSFFSVNCPFLIRKSHSLSMLCISFFTYSFQPSSNNQRSTFSCTFFMILCYFKTSSSVPSNFLLVPYHHLLRHHLFLDLFSVVPSSTPRPRCVNSQRVSFTPVETLNSLCSICNI